MDYKAVPLAARSHSLQPGPIMHPHWTQLPTERLPSALTSLLLQDFGD